MNEQPENNGERIFRDLDFSALDREREELGKLVDWPITLDIMRDWAGDSPERNALVADTVWATIRWSKTLGRPISPKLSNGFVASHRHRELDWVQRPGGSFEWARPWKELPAPTLYDLPDSDDEYRVGITSPQVRRASVNEVAVHLAPDVRWQIPFGGGLSLAGFKVIEPPVQAFAPLEHGSYTILRDFVVVRVTV